MTRKIVGVMVNGVAEFHAPHVGGGNYLTLCCLDGDDPAIGQNGLAGVPDGQKITCGECHAIWSGVRALKLKESDFGKLQRFVS